jgi:transcriptional regulator with XRE-family HTH domain
MGSGSWLRSNGLLFPLQRRFGVVLRRRREVAGLSQGRLAALASLHRNYVGLLERGLRMPSIAVAQQLAAALGMKMSKLLAEVERQND